MEYRNICRNAEEPQKAILSTGLLLSVRTRTFLCFYCLKWEIKVPQCFDMSCIVFFVFAPCTIMLVFAIKICSKIWPSWKGKIYNKIKAEEHRRRPNLLFYVTFSPSREGLFLEFLFI